MEMPAPVQQLQRLAAHAVQAGILRVDDAQQVVQVRRRGRAGPLEFLHHRPVRQAQRLPLPLVGAVAVTHECRDGVQVHELVVQSVIVHPGNGGIQDVEDNPGAVHGEFDVVAVELPDNR
jgi:hypothetical protein